MSCNMRISSSLHSTRCSGNEPSWMCKLRLAAGTPACVEDVTLPIAASCCKRRATFQKWQATSGSTVLCPTAQPSCRWPYWMLDVVFARSQRRPARAERWRPACRCAVQSEIVLCAGDHTPKPARSTPTASRYRAQAGSGGGPSTTTGHTLSRVCFHMRDSARLSWPGRNSKTKYRHSPMTASSWTAMVDAVLSGLVLFADVRPS
jgi:hypothetical protein